MARRRKSQPKLKVLPQNPTGSNRIPKPKIKPSLGGEFSQRAMKAQVGISVPGVKIN